MVRRSKQVMRGKKEDQHPESVRIHKLVGQLQGIEKMLADRRPLSQVVQQVQAASAGLTSLKMELLRLHLENSMNESRKTGDYDRLLQEVEHIVRMQGKQ